MKNVIEFIGTLILIILETLAFTLGYYYATEFLSSTQAAISVVFASGAVYFVIAMVLLALIDWGYFTLLNKVVNYIEKGRQDRMVTLRDPEDMCPLGGSVSRGRCDYCTHCAGEFGGSIKCKYKTK